MKIYASSSGFPEAVVNVNEEGGKEKTLLEIEIESAFSNFLIDNYNLVRSKLKIQ